MSAENTAGNTVGLMALVTLAGILYCGYEAVHDYGEMNSQNALGNKVLAAKAEEELRNDGLIGVFALLGFGTVVEMATREG